MDLRVQESTLEPLTSEEGGGHKELKFRTNGHVSQLVKGVSAP